MNVVPRNNGCRITETIKTFIKTVNASAENAGAFSQLDKTVVKIKNGSSKVYWRTLRFQQLRAKTFQIRKTSSNLRTNAVVKINQFIINASASNHQIRHICFLNVARLVIFNQMVKFGR